MKKFFVALAVCAFSFGLMVADAEAKRFGGGRSMGMQRQATPAPQKAAPAPANAASPTAAAPKSSWMGPLAGLAAGLGIAALLSHFGLGEGMANLVMIALLAMAAMFVFKWLFRRRAAATAGAGQPMSYAGAGAAGGAAPTARFDARQDLAGRSQPEHLPGGAAKMATQEPAGIPADFDVDGFLRVAKLNFVRLQAANDAGNMEDIRAFVSPEVFAEIKLQMGERSGANQQTDVVTVDAELLEVLTEGSRHVASVRMNGMIREQADAPAVAFDEVWNLTKPVDGSSGWVVAGIQQAS
ncbi:Tim44-like domain-containing protein [Candidatus Accumulibacter sp. ACC007]|uniref:Tim44 domain-containing protein n=1 Tax=Candidatus Accumulibacter sp. ACC007 TaxID=2823333 RepID=UPI0025B9D9E8|nr:Tim44-like domain-containing protein [Candidatus Accumulibacter sp. ACC007]